MEISGQLEAMAVWTPGEDAGVHCVYLMAGLEISRGEAPKRCLMSLVNRQVIISLCRYYGIVGCDPNTRLVSKDTAAWVRRVGASAGLKVEGTCNRADGAVCYRTWEWVEVSNKDSQKRNESDGTLRLWIFHTSTTSLCFVPFCLKAHLQIYKSS